MWTLSVDDAPVHSATGLRLVEFDRLKNPLVDVLRKERSPSRAFACGFGSMALLGLKVACLRTFAVATPDVRLDSGHCWDWVASRGHIRESDEALILLLAYLHFDR